MSTGPREPLRRSSRLHSNEEYNGMIRVGHSLRASVNAASNSILSRFAHLPPGAHSFFPAYAYQKKKCARITFTCRGRGVSACIYSCATQVANLSPILPRDEANGEAQDRSEPKCPGRGCVHLHQVTAAIIRDAKMDPLAAHGRETNREWYIRVRWYEEFALESKAA